MGSQPPFCNFGWKARDFDLPATDGNRYTLEKTSGPNGLLVMFICNHCPYVKAIRDLFEAMKAIAESGRGPTQQIASMGCSIKWRR